MTSNLFTDLPSNLPDELFTTLLEATNLRIERIVSHGHSSPEGFWYDQNQNEWVLVLQGAARLSIEGKSKELKPGDHINIPAHQKHRVEWTSPDEPTVWLAVFYGEARSFMERQGRNMPKESKSEIAVPLRIVLVDPPAGVDFGIQEGKGNEYRTIAVQRSKAGNLTLDCTINVKGNRSDGPPNFSGPISQGPPTGRFIYIDIGKSAGQFDSCWQRRIKSPLEGITWDMIDSVLEKPKRLLQATIPGTAKDGGPSCATIKPIEGWKMVKA